MQPQLKDPIQFISLLHAIKAFFDYNYLYNKKFGIEIFILFWIYYKKHKTCSLTYLESKEVRLGVANAKIMLKLIYTEVVDEVHPQMHIKPIGVLIKII